MSLPVRMADSVTPASIPGLFRQRPNAVAGYIDGLFAWTQEEIDSFPRHWLITVLGDVGAAEYARVIDVERGDARPADVPDFLDARSGARPGTGIVYCDRSTFPTILPWLAGRQPWWWISTLDQIPWTPGQLASSMQREYGVSPDPAQIAAIQNIGMGSYDQSTVYHPDFSKA
jgi:hypothetical protein